MSRLTKQITSIRRPKILIGPITRDKGESVGMVNEAFMAGLQENFEFVPHIARRSKGAARQGRFNLVNIYYLVQHTAIWLWLLVCRRPRIAHYGITADWNLEKSALLLKLARLCGVATIGHLHGGDFFAFWAGLPSWRRRWAHAELKRLSAFVVLSDTSLRDVEKYIGLDSARLFVVNNPIDSEFERKALGFPLERRTTNVLCFGVMDRKKGVFDIIEAAALLPKESVLRFKLVGPEREPGVVADVKSLIEARRLSAKVELVGPAFDQTKIQLFADAAILLHPSHVENFPLTVLEGAAAGLPIITTAVGAVPGFFQHGSSAMLVEIGRPVQIAEALTTLELSAERRHELGAGARHVFVSRLRRERIMQSLKQVYDSVDAP